MIITVAGRQRLTHAPERATVPLSLSFESRDQAKAMDKLQQAVAELAAELENLRALDPFPITSSVIQAPGTRSWQPWDDQGKQLPMRHAATVRASVQFCDFTELAARTRVWGARSGWSIENVAWDLTSDTRARLSDEALADAIAAAQHRAEVMAHSAGVGEGARVRLVEIADAGLLNGGDEVAACPTQTRFSRSMGSASDGLVIEPEEIEVIEEVHARFEA